MLADDIADRISLAAPGAELDDIVRGMWGRHFAGDLTEDEVEGLQEAAQARRAETRPKLPAAAKVSPTGSARRPQPCQSPDRMASIRRRRRIGYSGVLPSPIAEHFTIGQTAALRIVLDEIRDHGRCTLPLAIIAARSGTSKSTVRRALRRARDPGINILTVKERRSDRRGVLSDTNIVTLISAEVRAWIFRRGGRQKWRATDTSIQNTSSQRSGMVSGYRPKGLGGGSLGHRPTEKGGTAARGGPI
jgi:hypothetical protein